MREVMSVARRSTSSRKRCTSSLMGAETAETDDGVETSIILSAMSANFWRSVVASAVARTMRTLAGRRWRKSSFIKACSSRATSRWSPSSCCIRRRS